jgi:hypothetical protein
MPALTTWFSAPGESGRYGGAMHGNGRGGRGGERLSSLIREIRARPQQNWVPQQNYSCSGERSAAAQRLVTKSQRRPRLRASQFGALRLLDHNIT